MHSIVLLIFYVVYTQFGLLQATSSTLLSALARYEAQTGESRDAFRHLVANFYD